MGCDIHAFIEERNDRKPEWWVQRASLFIWRDYGMFGALAGVRVDDIEYVEPRGLPDKLDWGTKEQAEKWKDDGHSWSWLNADEIRQARDRYFEYADREGFVIDGHRRRQFNAIVDFMNALADGDPTRCRMVFWFDN